VGGGDPVQKFRAHMGLGTKNREKQTAVQQQTPIAADTDRTLY
jgi:hypothetical protein